ncbi:MAG: SIS domain-containing protein [Anaerolineaceae bacterium]|jgi:glucosamine--fructose-6-phosphate aminotransferase (isomerizing)|nr:SIS domain-containing protein [Anaerolineaceae bacterium]
MSNIYTTPLVAPDSPLDEHSKNLVEKIYEEEMQKMAALPSDDPLDRKRRMRVEFTWTEIWEQPDVLKNNLELESAKITEIAAFLAKQDINKVYLTGCGDSMASLAAVRSFFERALGIRCEAIQALDFTYYYHYPVDKNTLIITLSSSGSTVRTVEAMLLARAKGAVSLTLSNTPGSPLMEESDRGILIHAQRKGWPTQSSTAAMVLLYKLGIEWGKLVNRAGVDFSGSEAELYKTPEKVLSVLENITDEIEEIAEKEINKPIYLFASGGPAYACSLFGAAKVKECTPDHALAIPLEEFHHYNSQKVNDPMFLIAPDGLSIPRALDTAKQGKAWGGKIYSVVTEGNLTLQGSSDQIIFLPKVEESMSPILYSLPVQLFAYHLAMKKFLAAENN